MFTRYMGARTKSSSTGTGTGTATGTTNDDATPASPATSATTDVLVSGAERPGVGERWHGLPRRVRRVVGCAVAVVVLMGLGGYAYGQRADDPPPGPRPDAPPPPARALQMWSTGVGYPTSEDPRSFALGFVADVTSGAGSEVTVERVRQTYDGLRLSLAGDRPVRVPRERRVTVDARIVSCDALPAHVRAPVMRFTVRDEQGRRQTLRLSPGKRYAEALAATARAACTGANSSAWQRR